jgi:hypothetical protein
MWLTDKDVPGKPTDDYTIWLPDSCWINGQKYSRNVQEWLSNWMPQPFLASTVQRCDTLGYEVEMRDFLEEFGRNVPLPAGRGQIRSSRLQLHGHQCRYSDPIFQSAPVQQTLDYLSSLMDFRTMRFPSKYRLIRGIRRQRTIPVSGFVIPENVFSYAIPKRDMLDFTLFDNF